MGKQLIAYSWNKTDALRRDERCLFSRLSFLYDHRIWDRFNYLNQFNKYNFVKFDDELPEYRPDLDFGELCFKRASELIEQYPEGIAVSWSGGIDSTGVLASLLLAGLRPEKLHVICNSSSILEAPEIFAKLALYRCKITRASPYQIMEHFDNIPEQVILSGHNSDQLYMIGGANSDHNLYKSSVEDVIKFAYEQNNFQSYVDHDLEIFDNYSKLVNWEVNDFYDFSHLINFGCRVHYMSMVAMLKCDNPETINKFKPFYYGKDFFDWGYSNKQQSKEDWVYYALKGDNSRYKPMIKQLIHSAFDDDSYTATKLKDGSWQHFWNTLLYRKTVPYYISVKDADGVHVSFFDGSLSKKRALFLQDYILNDYLKDEYKQ